MEKRNFEATFALQSSDQFMEQKRCLNFANQLPFHLLQKHFLISLFVQGIQGKLHFCTCKKCQGKCCVCV